MLPACIFLSICSMLSNITVNVTIAFLTFRCFTYLLINFSGEVFASFDGLVLTSVTFRIWSPLLSFIEWNFAETWKNSLTRTRKAPNREYILTVAYRTCPLDGGWVMLPRLWLVVRQILFSQSEQLKHWCCVCENWGYSSSIPCEGVRLTTCIYLLNP